MVLVNSTMLELGTEAPDFRLPDPAGRMHALADFADAQALLVAFICNHCPYVKHIKPAFSDFAREYGARGLAVVAISSNDISTHPADAPEKMQEDAETFGYTFPYLFDESQAVAKTYRAACTPDFFLFDAERRLVYRGRFDESSPGKSVAVTGADLRRAVDATLAGERYDGPETPSMGCNIKWKPGNAPDYFR